MRLDNDCIRDILLYIEKTTDSEFDEVIPEDLYGELKKYDINTINYHLKKLQEACLIGDLYYSDNTIDLITDLTWEGHQYLENIRNDNVWSSVKDKASALGSVSLQVLISLAEATIKQKLGLN